MGRESLGNFPQEFSLRQLTAWKWDYRVFFLLITYCNFTIPSSELWNPKYSENLEAFFKTHMAAYLSTTEGLYPT